MKKAVLALMLAVSSCNMEKVSKRISIVYVNGDKETISVSYLPNSDGGVYFSDGCIYLYHQKTKYDSPYQGCVRCGVRSYYVID